MTKAPFLQSPAKPGEPFLATAKAAAARDKAAGTGPQRTPKPYTDIGEPEPTPSATPDLHSQLHSALHAVGDELERHEDKRASLSTIGVAFKKVAARIKPPSGTGEPEPDTRGLLQTPAPEM